MLKEISMKRIARWSLASLIVMLFIAYGFGVGIASAFGVSTGNASGFLQISVGQSNPNYGFSTASGSNFPDYTTFYFDVNDWNALSYFSFVGISGITTIVTEADSTQFLCVSGCTGSGGTVSFSKTANKIEWFFASDTKITSSPFVVSYNRDIFKDQIISSPNSQSVDPTTLSANLPMGFKSNTSARVYGSGGATPYSATVSKIVKNAYTYTEIGSGIFLLNVNKTGFTISNTKWRVSNSTNSTFFQESSFNHVDFNSSGLFSSGVKINMTDASGNYDFQFINVTGFSQSELTGVTANNKTTPGLGGSPSGQIYYDYSSGTVGSAYGINVSISQDKWISMNPSIVVGLPPFAPAYIYAYDSFGLVTGFPIRFTTQRYNTTRMFIFNRAGIYKAILYACSEQAILLCSSAPDDPTSSFSGLSLVDTATISVSEETSGYSVTTDKATYQPGQTINITTTNPTQNGVFLTAFSSNDFVVSSIAQNLVVPPGTTTFTKKIPSDMPTGTFRLTLATTRAYFERVATTFFNMSAPDNTSNTLFVAWGDTRYPLGDTGLITTVSNLNASTLKVKSPGGIIQAFSFSKNSTNITSIELNEPGIWNATLSDNGNTSNFLVATTISGVDDPTANQTFATCKSAATYVCWNKKSYQQGEAFIIEFKLTKTSTDILDLVPYIQISSPSNSLIFNRSINGSFYVDLSFGHFFGSISGNFAPNAPTGIYFARLVSPSLLGFGDIKTHAESATEVVQGTATGTTQGGINGTGGSGSAQATALIGMLASGMFWSLLITGGLMLAIAWRTKDGLPTGIIGVLSMGAFTFIGMMPTWIFFSVIIVASLLIAGSIVEKQTRNVTK